jgi:hypothetical protein
MARSSQLLQGRDSRKAFPTSLIPRSGNHGVYGIISNVDARIYVGSAVDLYDRYSNHKLRLIKGNHYSEHIQEVHNTHPEALEFCVIEEVKDVSTLRQREQFWMDFYQSYLPEKGFNKNPKSDSPLGRKLTEDARSKIGKSKLGKLNTKVSKPVIQWSVDGIKLQTFPSASEAGRQLKIPVSCIVNCIAGRNKKSGGFKWTYAPTTV